MSVEETAVETLGRLVGQQRREAEDTRSQLRTLTQRVGDHDASTRALTRQLGDFEGVTRTQLGGIAKQIERQAKSLSALHINSRLGSQTELSGRQRLLRHAVLHVLKQPGDDAARTWVRCFGSNAQKDELAAGGVAVLRRSPEELLHRASVDPAKVSVPTWAGLLTVTDVADFLLQTPFPSVFAQLSALGTSLEFANTSIPLPTMPATPSGGWIAEGGPIPASAGTLVLATLPPHKAAVLAVYSNEQRDLSTPSIESVLEFLLAENLRRIIDTTLLDATAASATRPAGLRNGVVGLTPSALTDPLAALVADVKSLTNAVLAAGGTSPVILLDPEQAISMALVAGTGLPSMIVSPSVPADTVICVDAASFISALGAPRMSISKEVVVHEESTPLPLATGPQGTGVVATPMRSLWQSDASGLRMIFDASWAMADSGRVAWMTGVGW